MTLYSRLNSMIVALTLVAPLAYVTLVQAARIVG